MDPETWFLLYVQPTLRSQSLELILNSHWDFEVTFGRRTLLIQPLSFRAKKQYS